ncbi:MAG: hypothetical protein R3293_23535, partial [Candidatus Promineifilaceae bacterium]|nr:hypothetical protein [Candidatus Promineifilaceae bacterium]
MNIDKRIAIILPIILILLAVIVTACTPETAASGIEPGTENSAQFDKDVVEQTLEQVLTEKEQENIPAGDEASLPGATIGLEVPDTSFDVVPNFIEQVANDNGDDDVNDNGDDDDVNDNDDDDDVNDNGDDDVNDNGDDDVNDNGDDDVNDNGDDDDDDDDGDDDGDDGDD